MYKILIVIIPILLFLPTQSFAKRQSASLISYTSKQGSIILSRIKDKTVFLKTSAYFVTQKNRHYCGIATAAIVLNAAHATRPVTPSIAPFRLFNQNNIFTDKTLNITTPTMVNKQGVSIKQISQIISLFRLKTAIYFTNMISEKQFKKLIILALKQHKFIIVDIQRSKMLQTGGGHFSPIAAYDANSDRFLFMDVSRYKYLPTWVPSHVLWNAMHTKVAPNTYRGFLIITPHK